MKDFMLVDAWLGGEGVCGARDDSKYSYEVMSSVSKIHT